MSDGVILNAEVRRPDAPGRFPVIVTITPYNGTNGAVSANNDYFVQRGYVQVVVDARGTGESQGTWDDFGSREQRDGYEVVEWAAAQSWSNGSVGMWGPSYMAITQLLTAAQRPPHLKAIFPIVPMGDSYRDMVFPGGQNNTGFIPFWLVLVSGSALIPPDYALDGNTADLARALGELGQHALDLPGFDANFELQNMAGNNAYDGPGWKLTSPLEVVDKIRVPTFVVGGEHDIFHRGEPLIYERLKNHVPTRLLIGPWTHVDGSSGAGLPEGGVPSLDSIALRWFDQYLKGVSTNIPAIPRVTQYVLGTGQWETRTDWPDPGLTPSRFYLGAGNTLAGSAPQPSTPDTFVQNPVSGVCTQSTSQWSAGLLAPVPCTTDNRLDEATSGVSYTTAPLAHDLHFDGPLFADIWVSTTASDAVVTVRATDVAPDGTSTELTVVPRRRPVAQPLRRRPADAAVAPVHSGVGAAGAGRPAHGAPDRDLPDRRCHSGGALTAPLRRPERLPTRSTATRPTDRRARRRRASAARPPAPVVPRAARSRFVHRRVQAAAGAEPHPRLDTAPA
jgi:putative CocE/NonD family hydrolase